MKNCVICFDKISNNNKITLSCNHIFHYNCIKIMITKRSRRCPLCRTKITWNIDKLNNIFNKQKPKIIRKSKRNNILSR